MTEITNSEGSLALATLMRFYAAETAYVAAGGGDFTGIAETLAPDCVLRVPDTLSYGGVYLGPEGFEAWSKAFSEKWSELAVRDAVYYPSGDRVFVEAQCYATVRETGKRINWPLLQYYIIKDDRIQELRAFYWDTAYVLEALKS